MKHTSWSGRDGAPVDANDIAQTEDGFLWFAASSGLIRFDGVQFEHYAPAPGEQLPANSIRRLLALPHNALLIGWLFGGATILQNGHVRNFGEAQGFPSGATYNFLRDRDGRIWAANSAGLVRLEGDRWRRIGAESNFSGTRAQAIFEDHEGVIGVFGEDSLQILPAGASTFREVAPHATTHVPIVQSSAGTYLVSDLNGIQVLKTLADYGGRPGRMLWINPAADRSESGMMLDRDGALWFSSPQGIARIAHPEGPVDGPEFFTDSDGLSDRSVRGMFRDRSGNIWVATTNGVDQFRNASFLPPTGLLRTLLPSLLPEPDGGLLFAGLKYKLSRLAPDGQVQQVEPISISAAYRDRSGAEWYGSQPGFPARAELIQRASQKTRHIALPADVSPELDIQAIAMDLDGSIWVSVVRKGIYVLRNGAWTQPENLPNQGKSPAITLLSDSQGCLWLGYPNNQLARWDHGNVQIYSAPQGLHVGNVLALHEHGSHLWVGGGEGMALFNSGRLRRVHALDEAVLRGITGIVETKQGDLWVHGIAGAVRIEAPEVRRALAEVDYQVRHRLFGDEDGLYGKPTDVRPLPTLAEGYDGRLWFSTYRGVFSLDPHNIVSNAEPPTVILKSVRTGTTVEVPGVTTTLPALSSNLQFDYTATGLTIAQRARFRYRLSGVDAGWQDAGTRRQAFYTNLGPGKYRFQVIASNENDVWNLTGASMDFSIAPAWYQTILFRALCVCLVIGLLLLLFALRLAQMRSQLQARLQERILERERIARELHDTLLQGFQGLILLFGAIRQRLPADHPTHDMMSSALVRANDVLAEGRDRVKGLRDTISLPNDLAAALREVGGDLRHLHSGEFALSVAGAPRPLTLLMMTETYQIAREALTNAFTHANAKNVNLELIFAGNEFRLRITDDGRGIGPDTLAHGGVSGHFGIRGMQERAHRMNAKLNLRSGPQSGTEVELRVPRHVAYERNERRWWRTVREGEHDQPV